MDTVKYTTTGANTVRDANDKGITFLDDISKIPSGTAGGNMPAITYSHFDGSSGSLTSTFPSLFGNSTGGRLGSTYSIVNTFNKDMKEILLDNAEKYSTD